MEDYQKILDNEVTQDKIERLEKKMLRAMREHLLGDPLAIAQLEDTDNKIKLLRQELQ